MTKVVCNYKRLLIMVFARCQAFLVCSGNLGYGGRFLVPPSLEGRG